MQTKAPTMPYTPELGSLSERVCAFFHRNRDETLSGADIVRKFDLPDNKNVHAKLESAVNGKFLVRNGAGYSAGPLLGSWTPTNGLPHPRVGAATAAPPATKSTSPRQRIDPATIVIETGVVKPAIRACSYVSIIQAMAPGNSVKLPHPMAKRFLDWARKLAKRHGVDQRWSLRKVDETETRVWRDA